MSNLKTFAMRKMMMLFVLFVLGSVAASAQFTKGQKVIGGSMALAGSNANYVPGSEYKSQQLAWSFNPSFGWFSKTNRLCGISLLYDHYKQDYTNSNSTYLLSSSAIGIGAFSQRFYSLAGNLYFTVNNSASASYVFGKAREVSLGTERTSDNSGYRINLGIAPGISYQLSPRFLIDGYLSNLVNVSYTHLDYEGTITSSEGSKSDNFSLSTSLGSNALSNLGVGFRWLLKN
jgi:hypothetical protein